MFLVSLGLSRTVLKGEVSTFNLELPPYRPPRFWKTIYTSIIDRTLIVLWRAIVFAAPAGAVIWLVANVNLGETSIANYIIGSIDGFGLLVGLNGVILLAYIVAIPANEIAKSGAYDFIIENKTVTQTVEQICQIISERKTNADRRNDTDRTEG